MFDEFRAGNTEAFDDLLVAEYAQHNPQADTGRQVAKDFFASVSPIDVDVRRMVAEGDLIAVRSHYKNWNMAGVDIFRFDDEGKILEHWDVLRQVPDSTASGNDLCSQVS